MFQFMRKGEKDKKPAKGQTPVTVTSSSSSFSKKVKDKLSPEDLHRLDEIRRSFKLGKAKKEKQKLPSGITADYSENFMVQPPVQQSVTMPSLRGPYGDSRSNSLEGYGVSVSVTHSDSSESSLSAKSLNLPVPPVPMMPPEIPAKPPRAPPPSAYHQSARSPPPVPARPSTTRYSSDYSAGDTISQQAYSPSRPPTSASTSSFTPTFVTPPQSPNHNVVSATKFYVDPEIDLGDQVNPKPTIKHGFYRIVNVKRLPTGDFGFSVRKASVSTKTGGMESILFVEPSQGHGVRDFSNGFLLPGDRLIAVNNIRSDSKTRDEMIEMITSSSGSVTLKVQSASHWIENIHKINHEQDENGYSQKDSNCVWLVHKSGFVKGRVIERIDEAGRCKVQLDNESRNNHSPFSGTSPTVNADAYSQQTFMVSEDDVEAMNPPCMDLSPHLWSLNMVNESNVIHVLRNRYHSSLPCTVVSHNMMFFFSKNAKPDLETQHLLKSVTQAFTHSKLLPNVYSSAQQAYRGMIINKRHQSILVHGQSNIHTKREIVREVMSYLSENTSPKQQDKVLNLPSGSITIPSFVDRLVALTNMVEFFCSSSDMQFEKSTVMYNLEFDLGGRIIGINSQIFLLDVERIYEGPYFGILQALHDLSNCPVDLLAPYPVLKQLKKDLKLTDTDADNTGNRWVSFFLSDIGSSSDPEGNLLQISNILSAMVTLGLGETFTKSVWSVFGAVYHLGHVVGTVADALQNNNSKGGSSSKSIETGQQHFKSACSLLGLSLENVEKTLIMDDNDISRIRNVLGFSIGLFIETVNSLFTTVNKSNSVGFRNVQCLSINIIQVGVSTIGNSARFGDLASNYLNDRISKLLKEVNFDRLEKLYQSENITYDTRADSGTSNGESESFKEAYFMNHYESLPLLDSFPSAANHSSKAKGFLYFMDDAKEPARCLEKFESEFYGENQFKNLYAVDFRNTSLTLAHSSGTHIVEYDVKKILHHVDLMSASKFTNVLIQDSQKDNINCMFLKSSNSVIGICMSAAAPDGSLRRTASIRRNFSTTWQKKSASINIKIQTDYLTDILGRTQIQSIKCLNPFIRSDGDIDVPSLRRQIRSDNITDLIRFYKSSYPLHVAQTEFVRRFKCLGSPAMGEEGFNVQQRVADIFDKQDLPSSSFKLGNSLVFMKPWVLNELEIKQTLKLEELFSSLQSRCRGSITRKRLESLKLRDVAIKCIQKNVRKLLAVRDWSWWKLYQQISPLLKVQSSHEKLQNTQDELSSLKLRFEKAEAERNRLKDENEKLEIRVNELSAELAEEQATSAASAEKIEQEMTEKQQIESQLVNLKTRYQSIENEKQQLELDLAYSISEVGGEANSADEFNDDSVYKQRWERCKRELEMTKQRLKQREQDHLDQIMIMKKSLEKKCCDAWEESEEQKQIVAQLKRRIQKLSNELSDVKCLHQEEASRASLLEKKQRRFDSELSTSNMQLEKEKLNKDKIIRERDAAVIQKDSLFNEMQALKMELQLKETKLHNTEQELEELSQSGGSSDQVNALRKTKNDLQMKVKEQEEELDDMAGQVQTLESTKLRLEMQMEQMRKECKREVQLREEEIEDLRNSTHKKFKALECQLESEHEERTTILRAKQELERRVFDLEEFSSTQTASHEHISRLKKELKRTKALLKDSQAMMEQSKNDVLSKGMLRQLRHQLEDSESQRVRLNRAKQKVDEELSDALLQIEELTRRCNEAENEKNNLSREKANIHMQFEEGEENLAEIMKKYKAAVEQLTVDQTTITEQCIQISELEAATSSLKETISELTAKLETLEGDHASQQIQKRFQLKVREVETRLELETTTRTRLEGQVSRLKEHIEKFTEDLKNVQTRELTAADKLKKCERQLRESKEDILRLTQRESDLQGRRANLEKQLESADLEISTLKGDLKLAMQRIEDLTNVIRECDETTDDDDDDSSTESIDSNNDSSILSDAQFDLGNIKLSKQNDESTA